MLLRLDKVSLAYGSRPLLDQVSLQLDEGERVGLVGRNGEGKSSLLRLVRHEAEPDAGSLWVKPGARVAHLAQDAVLHTDESVAQIVTGGLLHQREALAEYQTLAAQGVHSQGQRRRLDELHHALDAAGGWQLERRVATVISRLQLDPGARFEALSGGWRRRALLARALVSEPDILLLDEPTNHLDIDAIEWLEQFLLDFSGALLFVSHDRAFINRLATRIVELDRGNLSTTFGNYDDYARIKAQLLAAEAQHRALFDKKLAQEETWIRKGVEARRTRNEGRVRALYQLRAQRRARRERSGSIELEQHVATESGALVFEAEHLGVEFDGRTVIRDFSGRIMRGDRIGLVGPNGAGKSTLIKALLGEIAIQHGQVRRGSRLEVAYYDQERAQLNLDESVMQNISGRNDQVIVNGKSRHVSGYLQDFLFRPEQLHTPAHALSGGERNRLLLARLFAQPANVLVMDEPTNDLDIDTLELVEEYVAEFPGTLLLVSHDRTFLDHVVTGLLVFEGDGVVGEFVGGYDDWIRYRRERDAQQREQRNERSPAPPAGALAMRAPLSPKARRLSYKDQRELIALPERLQGLEAEKGRIEAELADGQLYRGSQDALQERLQRLAAISVEIEGGYARWSELEALAAGN
ncbi:MAG: ATP-binding cassette domain-containing protein [Steroidobacterales bacterium]